MSEQIQKHIKDRFQVIRKIGSGAYGHVWKVKDRTNNQIVALKKIFDAFQHATDAQRTYREIFYLRQFKHENIIKMRHVFKSENEKDVYIVFDFMEVDLHRVIRQSILKEKHKRYIVYQIAKALKYIHSAELIHRDLKPSNVLVNQDCTIKVCDFGLVRSAGNQNQKEELIMTQYVATRWYRAPQLLLGWSKYSKSVDIWSFGCLIGQLFKGKPLFAGSSTLDQMEKVINWTGYPTNKDLNSIKGSESDGIISAIKASKNKPALKQQWFVGLQPELRDLISKMLIFHPSRRPTIQQVLLHPYLESFHDPDNEKTAHHPIHLDIDDSTRLTVKAYRQKIWRLCGVDRQNNSFHSQQPRRSEDYSNYSRASIKRRPVKSVMKSGSKQTDLSRTVYLKDSRTKNFKSTVISPPVPVKPVKTYAQQRKLTDTQTPFYSQMSSCKGSKARYNDISKHTNQRSLNGSDKALKYEQSKSKPQRRSLSTVKNRRSVFNCKEYKRFSHVD